MRNCSRGYRADSLVSRPCPGNEATTELSFPTIEVRGCCYDLSQAAVMIYLRLR